VSNEPRPCKEEEEEDTNVNQNLRYIEVAGL
jgi:hypothetical protein